MGDDIASWFQKFLDNTKVRLVQHVPGLQLRASLIQKENEIISNPDDPVSMNNFPHQFNVQLSIADILSRHWSLSNNQ